jgi:16S rRNA processing protein RimM
MVKTTSWKTADLIGCSVFTETGELLGVMKDVLPSGGNDIWVVQGTAPSLPELLIPALHTVVRDVDISNKKIIVLLPPGLRDVYAADDGRTA